MKVKNIVEWSIVRSLDGRLGVLSHHAPRGKSVILFSNGEGVEINNNEDIEEILTTAVGMRIFLEIAEYEYLKDNRRKEEIERLKQVVYGKKNTTQAF